MKTHPRPGGGFIPPRVLRLVPGLLPPLLSLFSGGMFGLLGKAAGLTVYICQPPRGPGTDLQGQRFPQYHIIRHPNLHFLPHGPALSPCVVSFVISRSANPPFAAAAQQVETNPDHYFGFRGKRQIQTPLPACEVLRWKASVEMTSLQKRRCKELQKSAAQEAWCYFTPPLGCILERLHNNQSRLSRPPPIASSVDLPSD